MSWSDPRVTCDVCREAPATTVLEFWEGIGADLHVDRHFFLTCSRLFCTREAATVAEVCGILVDTRPLTLDEAEEVSGLDLGGVTL